MHICIRTSNNPTYQSYMYIDIFRHTFLRLHIATFIIQVIGGIKTTEPWYTCTIEESNPTEKVEGLGIWTRDFAPWNCKPFLVLTATLLWQNKSYDFVTAVTKPVLQNREAGNRVRKESGSMSTETSCIMKLETSCLTNLKRWINVKCWFWWCNASQRLVRGLELEKPVSW